MIQPPKSGWPVAPGHHAQHSQSGFDSASHGNVSKAIYTLIAEFALQGYEVQSLGAGAYLVSDSRGYSKACADAAELYAVAKEMGVAL